MLVRKSYRFRVYPTPKQETRLRAWQGASRFLWNLAHEQRLMGYARPKGERCYPTVFGQQKELTELRAALPWLADVPRNVCAQLLAELDKAWQLCFKKLARAPRWKRRGHGDVSLCEPHPKVWRLDGAMIRFPKIGNLRAVVHRHVEGKPKTCTLRCEAGQWFANISCALEIADPARRDGPTVAIDRGVVNVVADSDGRIVEAPRYYEATRAALARAQRTVSRRKKGSKNREKAKFRVARLHQKAQRQRDHFLHVLSHRYAKSHGVVVIEKLNVAGMTASAKGTVEEPGSRVAQKSGLNRGILDAGWSRFAEMLRYKLALSGGTLIEVPAAYSSQTCSACGHVDADSRRSQSVFCCTSCGYRDHADLNASKVLLTRANRSGLPAEGDGARRNRKSVELRVPRRSPKSSRL